jgi:SAM-dependent methyltransferase
VFSRSLSRETSLEAKSSCPVCGGRFQSYRKGWIKRCSSCGVLSSELQPQISDHCAGTVLDENKRLRGLSAARRRSNLMILEVLKAHLDSEHRLIVDIGCGHGLFIRDAVEQGFEVEGIEPDGNVVETTRKWTGRTIRQGYFPGVLGDSERFDAIVFNDVLEHIPDVYAAVEACRNHLNVGGLVVLNCPDQRGVFYRAASVLDRLGVTAPFMRMWQYGLPSPHLWYFSVQHLVDIGRKAGFDVIEVKGVVPIALSGLWERVTYVNGQSRILNAAVFALTALALPFLEILPRDTSIVFLRNKRK